MDVLSIDHTNNNGAEHRKEIGVGGNTLYQWLKNNHYPGGFRVLCMNCNRARGSYGYCPHEKDKEECLVLNSDSLASSAA